MTMVLGASLVALLGSLALVDPARSQIGPRSCSEAYQTCVSKTRMTKECGEERNWCKKTGTFADPVTKTVTSGLQKK
jgi:hypothetical protein